MKSKVKVYVLFKWIYLKKMFSLILTKAVTKKLKIFGLTYFNQDIQQKGYKLTTPGKTGVRPIMTHWFPLNEQGKAFRN